jgi:hypothetical protein
MCFLLFFVITRVTLPEPLEATFFFLLLNLLSKALLNHLFNFFRRPVHLSHVKQWLLPSKYQMIHLLHSLLLVTVYHWRCL